MRVASYSMRFLNYYKQTVGYNLLIILGLLFVSTIIFISQAGAVTTDTARDGRLVTVHDRDEQRVILTHSQTVRDALKDADITTVAEDTVEPGLDEPLVASDYTVNIYRARPVIVVDGAIRQKIMTAAQTSETIVTAAGLKLHDQDKATLTVSQDIMTDGAGVVLTIDRATEFTLNLYGTVTTAYSRAQTVGAMIRNKSIKLGKDDTVSVDKATSLTAGITVSIWRNGVQTATVDEPIAYSVRKIQDVDQPAGYRKVQTPGTNGRKSVTYQITMKNGVEVTRKVIQSVTLEEPKEQVEVVGAKPVFTGDFAAALAKLRSCESGGNYANKKNPLYRGAYQYSYSTWGNKYGIYDPADATPAQQDQAAWDTYKRRGWQPWPNCGKNLPDTYR